jgi:hypothetical protein
MHAEFPGSTGKLGMGRTKGRSRRAVYVTGEAHVQLALTVLLASHEINTLLNRSHHEWRGRARLLADLPGLAAQRLGHLLRVERGLTRSGGGPRRWGCWGHGGCGWSELCEGVEDVFVELVEVSGVSTCPRR